MESISPSVGVPPSFLNPLLPLPEIRLLPKNRTRRRQLPPHLGRYRSIFVHQGVPESSQRQVQVLVGVNCRRSRIPGYLLHFRDPIHTGPHGGCVLLPTPPGGEGGRG